MDFYLHPHLNYDGIFSNAQNGKYYLDEPWLNPLAYPDGEEPIWDQNYAAAKENAVMQCRQDLCLCSSDDEQICELNQRCSICGAVCPYREFVNDILDCTIVRWTCIRKHTKRYHNNAVNEPAKVKKEELYHSPVIGPIVRQENEKLLLSPPPCPADYKELIENAAKPVLINVALGSPSLSSSPSSVQSTILDEKRTVVANFLPTSRVAKNLELLLRDKRKVGRTMKPEGLWRIDS